MFQSWFIWVRSWFSSAGRDAVLDVISRLASAVDFALPIVREIDEFLKPVVRDNIEGKCQTPIACLVEQFLSARYGYTKEQALEIGEEVSGLPLADLLLNVGVWALRDKYPHHAMALSALRAAVELAYQTYKTLRAK